MRVLLARNVRFEEKETHMPSVVDAFEEWWNHRLSLLTPPLRKQAYWTPATAALVAGKKKNTLRSWYNEGHVTGVRTGGTILIHVVSLREYLQNCSAD